MSERALFLGIDTSNYTTSVAVADSDGHILLNLKRLLPVKEGERGLRQSDALFAHTKNLPLLMQELGQFLEGMGDDVKIAAVGCSATPRDAEGSYMPCFLAGVSAAETACAVLGCRKYSFSHQNGHVMAALYSSGKTELLEQGEPFAAFHVSGGTTELLLVTPLENGFVINQIGGSADMNAGQAIDRTGVMMGLRFPCGREMESICIGQPYRKGKISVKGLDCNLSGLENLAAAHYKKTDSAEETSAYVLEYVAATLDKMTEKLRETHPEMPIIYAGGVMSNKLIKSRLAYRPDVYFASPAFSADNAAGIALLCRRRYLQAERRK